MSSIPPPKGGVGLKPPASKIGVAKAGGLKAGLLAKSAKPGGAPQTPAPPSRQQSSADLTQTAEFKGWFFAVKMKKCALSEINENMGESWDLVTEDACSK